MFEDCMKDFRECLSKCQENLTNVIKHIDEHQFFESYFGENSSYKSHFLSIEYDASKTDLQGIQLYLLFIGDNFIFLTTYAISIFAAAYGVSKFFRLSYSDTAIISKVVGIMVQIIMRLH